MQQNLYPTFEPPSLPVDPQTESSYHRSLFFDFASGDFVTSATGRMQIAESIDAYRQWCLKAVLTERYNYPAYTSDYGVEMYDAMREPTRAAILSAIERTITEAIMEHPMTESVSEFSHELQADAVLTTFVVKTKELDSITVEITLGAGGESA